MDTLFKLNFESTLDIDLELFNNSLPSDFNIEKKDDGIYVRTYSEIAEDERCQYLIDRELGRIFF